MSNSQFWLDTLKPNFKTLPLKERLLCGCGALLGLAISSIISWYALGGINAWYIAPMGASSVLLFAVPASPLAQPWNMVVGNTIAGLIGVSCALWIPDLTSAFSLAVGLSIFLMMTTDSLHPPSGAVSNYGSFRWRGCTSSGLSFFILSRITKFGFIAGFCYFF